MESPTFIFSKLAIELINHIINYTDVVVYRHGKYINRLKKDDYRLALLQKIPKPISIGGSKILLQLIKHNMLGYIIEYNVNNDCNIIKVRFFYKDTDGNHTDFDLLSSNTYLFTKNNRWSKILFYDM